MHNKNACMCIFLITILLGKEVDTSLPAPKCTKTGIVTEM